MRRNHIDNIRWAAVMLLFVYHAFMVYNTFDEGFYVKGADIQITSNFIISVWPWFMPLLFLLAGVSSAYSLESRSPTQYIKDRVSKLLLPLVFGVLLLIPVQTYFAEKFHNGFSGGYFEQYVLFFTKPTDLSGYTGGATPAHLWFIMYLFVISLAALPVMHWAKRTGKKPPVQKMTLPAIFMLFLIPGVSQVVLDLYGKSVGEYTAWFLIGYFVISEDVVQEKLRKNRFILTAFALPCMLATPFVAGSLEEYNVILYEFAYFMYTWVTIMAILGLGKQYLGMSGRFSAYMSKSSFGVYFIHQNWIVITAYFTLMWIENVPLQIITIILSSIVFTFLTYEAFRRTPVTRFMFGLKK